MWHFSGTRDNNNYCHRSSHVNVKFGEDAQIYQLVEGKLFSHYSYFCFFTMCAVAVKYNFHDILHTHIDNRKSN